MLALAHGSEKNVVDLRRPMAADLIADRDLHVEPVQGLGVRRYRDKPAGRARLEDGVGADLNTEALPEIVRTSHHLARGIEQDARLVARHRGSIALRTAFALDERAEERDRRGKGGLPIAPWNLDDALPKPPRVSATLNEAEQVRQNQLLPVHELDRLAGLRSLDVGQDRGQDQRCRRGVRIELPRRITTLSGVYVIEEPPACELHIRADVDLARDHTLCIPKGPGEAVVDVVATHACRP